VVDEGKRHGRRHAPYRRPRPSGEFPNAGAADQPDARQASSPSGE
jgi:hypothetical protein